MIVKNIVKTFTITAACLGIASTTTLAAGLTLKDQINLTQESDRKYVGEWYNDGTLVRKETFTRGQDISQEMETPVKLDTTGDNIYVFTGWDYNGDGLVDIPMLKAYSNFKANACYKELTADLLEKIDWEKLLEVLMNYDIDLEAILTSLGLSPEDIARLLNITSMTISSSEKGVAYLRTESFGDYNAKKKQWKDADFYPLDNISPGSVNPLQYTANKLSTFGSYYTPQEFEINYKKTGKKYCVLEYETINEQNLPSDSYSLADPGEDNSYTSIGYGLLPCTTETILLGKAASYTSSIIEEDELRYREYAHEKYLNVDENHRSAMLNLANTIGASSENLGLTLEKLTEYFTLNYEFDVEHNVIPKNQDAILYFVNNAGTYDANYFGSATTLFLRSLGFPARYTQGYLGIVQNPNEENPVTPLQAYSWCEVYVDGVGWMCADAAMYLLADFFADKFDIDFNKDNLFDTQQYDKKELVDLRIGEETEKHFYVGGTFDQSSDLELIAIYDDGSEKEVEPTYILPPDLSRWGYQTIMCMYREDGVVKTTKYEVYVEIAKASELMAYARTDALFYTDELITSDYFTFKCLYTNGKIFDIYPGNIYFDPITFDEPGTYTFTFTFEEYYEDGDYRQVTTALSIEVKDPPNFEYLEFYSLPNFYWQYDEFNLVGVQCIAHLTDGTTMVYTLSDLDYIAPDMNACGNMTVIILPFEHQTCKPYEYNFYVEEILPVSLNLHCSDIYYINHSSFEGSYYAEVSYNNLSTRDVTYDENFAFEKLPDLTYEHSENIHSSFTFDSPYSGLTVVEDNDLIEVSYRYIKTFESISTDIYIDAGHTLNKYDFSEVWWYATYNNGDNESVYGYDERIQIDYVEINTSSPGIFECAVSFDYEEGLPAVSSTVKVHVRGLDSIEAHTFADTNGFYSDREDYTLDDFGLYVIAYYFDGDEMSEPRYIYPDDEKLTITELVLPLSPGDFVFNFEYTDNEITKYDSLTFNIIKREVSEYEYHFENCKDTYRFTEIGEETFDKAYLEVTYNDGVTETYYQPVFSYELKNEVYNEETSTTTRTYEFTYEYNDEPYTKTFDIKFVHPYLLVNDCLVDDKIFPIYQYSDAQSFITNGMFEIKLLYAGDKEYDTITNSVTAEYISDPKPGTNTVLFTYLNPDEDYKKYNSTVEVVLFDISVEVSYPNKYLQEGSSYSPSIDTTMEVKIDAGDVALPDFKSSGTYVTSYNFNRASLNVGENEMTVIAYGTFGDIHFEKPDIDVIVNAYEYVGIEVEKPADTPEYFLYSEVDYTKYKIYMIFKDTVTGAEEREEIPYSEDLFVIDTETAGTFTCNISYTYNGKVKTTSFDYIVKPVTLIKITAEASGLSTYGYYGVAESFNNTSGLVVTAYFDNGTQRVITDYKFDEKPDETSTLGNHQVTVSYNGKTDSYDFEVKENKIENIKVTCSQSNYTEFDKPDSKTVSGTAFYSSYKDYPEAENSTEDLVYTDFNIKWPDPWVYGENIPVEVSLKTDPDLTDTFFINIIKVTPSITIRGKSSLILETNSDPITEDDISLSFLTYADDSKEISKTIQIIDNIDLTTTGEQTLYFSAFVNGETRYYYKNVKVLTTEEFNKFSSIYASYDEKIYIGGSFDENSLIVYGYTNGLEKRDLTSDDYTITGLDKVDFYNEGTYQLMVVYKEDEKVKAPFTITIVKSSEGSFAGYYPVSCTLKKESEAFTLSQLNGSILSTRLSNGETGTEVFNYDPDLYDISIEDLEKIDELLKNGEPGDSVTIIIHILDENGDYKKETIELTIYYPEE